MKSEIQNSILRLSFLCCTTDIKITWINPGRRQGFNQPKEMVYNIIFPTETNFPIKLRLDFFLTY